MVLGNKKVHFHIHSIMGAQRITLVAMQVQKNYTSFTVLSPNVQNKQILQKERHMPTNFANHILRN
jgi:hypothetical protein